MTSIGGRPRSAADHLPTRHVRPLLIGNETLTSRSGGLNRYLDDLVVSLRRCGARPAVVLVGDRREPGWESTADHDAPLIRRLLATRRAAVRASGQVDLVDAHFALYAVLPIFTTRLRRLPLVVHFQGPWADESAVGRGQRRPVVAAKRALERAVYRRAETVLVLSEAFGRLVVDRYGVDPARVVVVPPGVDLDRFSPGSRGLARRRLALPLDAFVAVSVRRLDARMGLDVLLDAWAKVQAERPDSVLVIAGDGRERERLESLAERLPDPGGVRFLGRVDDDQLAELYRAAHCSVVPTRALEGFGLVTLESAACGTPAVVTDAGGLPDGVVGLDPSLVVRAEDPAALAERLLSAAAGDLPGREACRRHAERFSWDEVARRHLDIFERAVADRPLRVAYVGHTAALSGGELALARLLPALNGVEPVVILGEHGPLVDRLRASGFDVEVLAMAERTRGLRRDHVAPGRLPLRSMFDTLGYAWRLRRRFRELRVDLVHTNTLKAALYGGVAGRLAGVPVVWHLRDRIAGDYLPRPAALLVGAMARALPSAVIANSRATGDTVGVAVTVVPSPVHVQHRSEGELARRADSTFLTVGLVGRLAPWKGQDLFLRAFAAAFPDGDQRAVVVGSGMFGEDEWAAALPRLARDLGIAERVEFTGFVEDVASQYARFDVAVHASTIPEPFGQVVIEAQAAGVPVVAADAGGPAEVITHGVDGLLYPMGDATALAACLRQLATDPTLRQRLAEAGLKRSADFRPGRIAEEVLAVYQQVRRRKQ